MTTSRITGPRKIVPLGPLDPREAAWRSDIADVALAGLVATPHYAKPAIQRIATRTATLHAEAKPDSAAVSELLFGEEFALLDSANGFGWGYSVADHYVGHVSLDALDNPIEGESRRIGPADALVFAEPDIKSPVLSTLPLGAHVVPQESSGDLTAFEGGWIHNRHLMEDSKADWVDIALSFVGAPYRWGGRTRQGVDCSGLIQIARQLAGLRCRRDSDMQNAEADEISGNPKRGDIAWWPGHIGILLGDGNLLHANAFHMSCVIEPLGDVSVRIGSMPRIARFR